jgi:hypothetical protein
MEQLRLKENIINKMDETNNVLQLCAIPESINIDIIRQKIYEYMNSRLEYYKYKNRSPYIEDEFSEYFTAISSQGFEIGAGHCGMDVITSKNEGIDAMCVIMNKDISNEKSLIQNFTRSGSNLDTLFKEKRDEEAVKLFMDDYLKKLEEVKKNKQLSQLYILAYISTNINIYIACFKLDISKIENVKSAGFVNNKKEYNHVNILIDNFIDDKFGKVTLYKSKKRVELRLKKQILNNENVIQVYSMM